MIRIFEIVLTCTLLLIFSPLFILIPLAIILDTGLPILYLSPRIGKDGKRFHLYYFRTMIDGTDPHDEQVTRVGRYLRHYSLDHFAQVFNLFKGDMHFIGPRPMRPEQARLDDATYQEILKVKPGVFNPAIIALGKTYNASPFATKIQLEKEYFDQRTRSKDIRFIGNSLLAFIKSRGNVKMHGTPQVDSMPSNIEQD